jgi:GTPase Era involved in 16S rRNA processing
MPSELQQLVRETVDAIGVEPPSLLDEHAVALHAEPAPFYLVGLIGGKEVGKSSIVNALVGKPIAQVTSFGEGTARVMAYAHASVEEPLRALLVREVPGQYTIVTHEQPALRRQVLLDLPDIDSRFAGHLALTRTMLRRMLYPIWVQSIEKYADLQPQKMLKEVAEGNSPENFLFCLSKADQLKDDDGQQLRDDFGQRITRVLSLAVSPRVYLISAREPGRYDLPALQKQLSKERSERDVDRSLTQAQNQQDQTLGTWLAKQDLPERAARATRLADDAREIVKDRVGERLLEQILPEIIDDPVQRVGIAQEIFERRIDRWPIVRLANLVLSPAVNLAETLIRGKPAGGALLVDRAAQIEPIVRPLSADVQAAFAQLRQSQPAVAAAYEHDKLWEQMNAELAVGRLRDRLAAAVLQQRSTAIDRMSGSIFGSAVVRWLATIGAALWFPIVQPVLSIVLNSNESWRAIEIARLAVNLLSGQKLLSDAAFLLIWYVFLWLVVRYRTYCQVRKWLRGQGMGSLDLAGEAVDWMDQLVGPLEKQRARLQSIADRAKTTGR